MSGMEIDTGKRNIQNKETLKHFTVPNGDKLIISITQIPYIADKG